MDAVIGNSRAVVRQLIDEGIPEAKVRLIYNGIDVSPVLPERNKARQALGIDNDTLVGVVIANLIHYKGHRELVGGLSHVETELPTPWRIFVAGRDHGIRAELEELAAARGISHRIQFLGEYSDIPRLLAAADFGLLTSREEGFSNVILECMAAGLAMVVTDVGGNAEAVLHGETGFVVPPRNPKAIGDAILELRAILSRGSALELPPASASKRSFPSTSAFRPTPISTRKCWTRSKRGRLPLNSGWCRDLAGAPGVSCRDPSLKFKCRKRM
jgi:glycosyltransferase involved in cell wall biosynthesis